MSAYSRAFQALTSGRAMRPDEAAEALAALRKEYGDELADALGQHATEHYRPKPTDTKADDRRKRRAYGAVMRAANFAREIAASPFRATIPPQGDTTNRSTS
ncbi:hypothetical protein UK15_07910 [Streptomyces variegatus]|uniref:Uncharacterized protein n=1 Tax=Streptomyces variegatus TaxID=284040 RepID=A0A0M2GQY9_9ACTN|nr:MULTISPECIES: hypothetical protein [Streptomyces]KJK40262.1 hypothetical protein UK15_07910 [Streptomyces variegatus]